MELVWYGHANASGTEEALAKMNKILKERYNTTLVVNHIGWGDWQSQYNLLLTSGENIDLIYVNSAIYSQYAPTGAFQDLTELFPEYMPETYKYFTEDELKQVRRGRQNLRRAVLHAHLYALWRCVPHGYAR